MAAAAVIVTMEEAMVDTVEAVATEEAVVVMEEAVVVMEEAVVVMEEAVVVMDRAMVEDGTTGIESAMASNPMKQSSCHSDRIRWPKSLMITLIPKVLFIRLKMLKGVMPIALV